MNNNCGCCEGIEQLIPTLTINQPGLNAINYRVGTHATFLETMLARLSNLSWQVSVKDGDNNTQNYYPLLGLKTRSTSDPAIAFLDAWATVADVLTFYQERIANEGYLRTATERHSVLELARLVGYKLRPGVAASVYVAYTLEDQQDVEIDPGNRVQSLPGPGELPQSFETSDKLLASWEWNNLKLRLTRPQRLSLVNTNTLYLQGTATNIKPNDRLLMVAGKGPNKQEVQRVKSVEVQTAENRTRVILQEKPILAASISISPEKPVEKLPQLDDLITPLTKPPSLQPANKLRLPRDLKQLFGDKSDNHARILTTFQPELNSNLYPAWRKLPVTKPTQIKVYVLRTRASVFGNNAPPRQIPSRNRNEPPLTEEWTLEKISATTEPEDFDIEVALEPMVTIPGPEAVAQIRIVGWSMQTKITIAGQEINDPPDQNSRRQLTDNTSFTIDHPAANESITVTYSVSANNQPRPFNLEFRFNRRPLVVTMGIDGDNHYRVSNDGSDPSIVSITKTSTEPPPIIGTTQVQTQTRFILKTSGRVKNRPVATEESNVLWLDAPYEQILPNSWVVVERPDKTVIAEAINVNERSRYEYGISLKGTRLELNQDWINPTQDNFSVIRETAVFAQSEELQIVEEPISEPIGNTEEIELGDIYKNLETGRWLIVSGERADLPGDISGVKASELVMLAGVKQDYNPDLPGDKTHTILQLANPLAYSYKRDTVTIYGNVVKATHGETRTEVLGGGDASKSWQSFPLQATPLTYLSAPTVAGSISTLEVRVNDIRFSETDSLADLKPQDRSFFTLTDDQGKTTVIFGNGEQGTRPATGIENITAVYRTGIGKPGNVTAEQISLLVTRPLGVRSVINPLPASGGADAESRDQARRNAPLAVMALDRLVSVQDYADFARTFAGIGKASATRLTDGEQQLVHLTIASADDSPIDVNSDLYRNFLQTLRQSGDPNQRLLVEKRELLLLVIGANLRISPDYQWESIVTKVHNTLLDTFSFEKRELGQSVFLSEVIFTIQNVPGVVYVDVDTFGAIPEKTTDPDTKIRRVLTPSEIKTQLEQIIKDSQEKGPSPWVKASLANFDAGAIQPAQIAYLSPLVADTLTLVHT
ncbi:MAG: putative baseplate assembly protein [Calothrix sp. C42_A2020_038]|nr:putative baseplate assembly protein [Calothrix sp. C42_A2020_038]